MELIGEEGIAAGASGGGAGAGGGGAGTGGGVTLGNVDLAVLAFVSGMTLAVVVVDQVEASRFVLTRIRSALVDVDLAVGTGETSVVAHTLVIVDAVLTNTAVQARITLKRSKTTTKKG